MDHELLSALHVALPDVTVIEVNGLDVTIASTGSPKDILDAERYVRRQTGVKYELFMERMRDANKQRIVFAKKRGAL